LGWYYINNINKTWQWGWRLGWYYFSRVDNRYRHPHGHVFLFDYINWRDVQKEKVVNNVDMSSLGHHDIIARAKTNTQNDTKTRTTSRRNRHLEKKHTIFCVFRVFSFFLFFFIHNFLNEFSKKCWVTALVRSMTFIWEFKPV